MFDLTFVSSVNVAYRTMINGTVYVQVKKIPGVLNWKNWNGPQASRQTDTIVRIEQVRLKTVGHSWATKMHSRSSQVSLTVHG